MKEHETPGIWLGKAKPSKQAYIPFYQMSSAVHVVGIKGVVLSLEGGKENGDGYKSDFS